MPPLDLTADQEALLEDFGETVVYRKRAGGTRSIKAIVDRQPPAPLGPQGSLAAVMTIEVANSATLGITAAELDTGGDAIDVALRVGGTAEARPILRMRTQDAGFLKLEVR